jgi:hypothetical protein
MAVKVLDTEAATRTDAAIIAQLGIGRLVPSPMAASIRDRSRGGNGSGGNFSASTFFKAPISAASFRRFGSAASLRSIASAVATSSSPSR